VDKTDLPDLRNMRFLLDFKCFPAMAKLMLTTVCDEYVKFAQNALFAVAAVKKNVIVRNHHA
jgi:hypothetical protein